MNLLFKHRINNCSSMVDASKFLTEFEAEILKLLPTQLKDGLKKTSIPLVITLIVNPSDAEALESTNHNNGVFSIVSKKIESDVYIYSFVSKLGRLTIPKHVGKILIAVGLEEFRVNSSESESNIDDDRPTFEVKNPKWSLDDVLLSDETKHRLFLRNGGFQR